MKQIPSMDTIAIIGLGKLGAGMAAAFATRGRQVIGVDVDVAAVDAINQGKAPNPEPYLADMIREAGDNLRAVTNHQEAVAEAQACFVIVPTPPRPDGAFSLQYVRWVMKEIGLALAKKDEYFLVAMTSTVLPGGCRHGMIPTIEEHSGKKAGVDFGFCYTPEFITPGTMLHDFLNPDFTLVGEYDQTSGDVLENIYAHVLYNGAECRRMSLENAELAKIALNSYISTKITFANTLAEMCNRIPGGDVDVVCEALGCDRRIGHRYFRGGMSYGGPYFPRDNRALAFVAEQLGFEADLATSTDTLNKHWLDLILERVQDLLQVGATVTILGMAYKSETPVLEASPSMLLAEMLSDAGFRVVACSVHAPEAVSAALGQKALVQSDPVAALVDSDMIIVATADPAFRKLTDEDFNTAHKGAVVYDLWRYLEDILYHHPHVRYMGHGRADDDLENPMAGLFF